MHFLEMLFSNLISTLKAHKIEGLFYFVKEDTAGGNREMAKPLPDSFEAILVFKPLDDSHYSLVTNMRDNSWLKPYLGQPVESRYKRKIDYKERFDIQLFAQPGKSDTIWRATLGVHCDFSKKPNISEIADSIISSLIKNSLLM